MWGMSNDEDLMSDTPVRTLSFVGMGRGPVDLAERSCDPDDPVWDDFGDDPTPET